MEEMTEIKDNRLLTHKHLRCTPEDRMRKEGKYGLTRFINTSKIGCFLPYNSIGIAFEWYLVSLLPGFQAKLPNSWMRQLHRILGPAASCTHRARPDN